MIKAEHSAEALAPFDGRTRLAHCAATLQQTVFKTLMIPLFMIMYDVLPDCVLKRCLFEEDQSVQIRT
jgi:hypothetical protein